MYIIIIYIHNNAHYRIDMKNKYKIACNRVL